MARTYKRPSIFSGISTDYIRDIKTIFHYGNTHASEMKISNDTVSKDAAICLYDYAEEILGGSNNGKNI